MIDQSNELIFEHSEYIRFYDHDIPILYQDENMVIVHKPCGLMVHKSPIGQDYQYLLQMLRDKIGQWVYPIHRIDRPTSGLVCFGLHSEAAHKLNQIWDDRAVIKTYHAIVRGFPESHGECTRPLKDENTGTLKEAWSKWQVQDQIQIKNNIGPFEYSRYSFLKLWPQTGRKHQLRRHLAQLTENGKAHPIIGDVAHGDRFHNRYFRDELKMKRLMLAAVCLEFIDPYSFKPIQVQSPTEFSLLNEWNLLKSLPNTLSK